MVDTRGGSVGTSDVLALVVDDGSGLSGLDHDAMGDGTARDGLGIGEGESELVAVVVVLALGGKSELAELGPMRR